MHRAKTNSFLIGDLILFRAAKSKSINLAAQSFLRRKRATYSHVAIVTDPTSAIHATPKDGVCQVSLTKLIKEAGTGNFYVLRNRRIDEKPDIQFSLREALLYYLAQKYNYLFFFSRKDTSSYCSELAAKAYRKAGLPLSGRPPKHTFPSDIEMLARNSEWLDATAIYNENYTEIFDVITKDNYRTKTDDILSKAAISLQDARNLLEQVGEFEREAQRFIQNDQKELMNISDFANKIYRCFELPEIDIKFNKYYWNTEHQGKKKSHNPRRRMR